MLGAVHAAYVCTVYVHAYSNCWYPQSLLSCCQEYTYTYVHTYSMYICSIYYVIVCQRRLANNALNCLSVVKVPFFGQVKVYTEIYLLPTACTSVLCVFGIAALVQCGLCQVCLYIHTYVCMVLVSVAAALGPCRVMMSFTSHLLHRK